ncbi:MAG: hypothetical protein E7019_06715 [Alphaproteobacteria bacterium]|nr:hypothetical protein [Alphaproteobacteria bacterium]
MLTEEEYLQYNSYFGGYISPELTEYLGVIDFHKKYEDASNRSFMAQHNPSNEEKLYMANLINGFKRQNRQILRSQMEEMKLKQKNGIKVTLPVVDQNISVADMSLAMAESMQVLYSEQNPLSEYYDWVHTHADIVSDMKIDGATEAEIATRDTFILYLEDREAELRVIESLYGSALNSSQGYYKEVAAQRLRFLHFKISELRRLRDNAKNVNYVKANEKELEKQQKEEAKMLVGAAALTVSAGLIQQQMYKQNERVAEELDSAVAGVVTHYQPVTQTLEDVGNKKTQLYSNNEKMNDALKILGLRGIISNENVKQQQNMDNFRARINRIRRPRGFNSHNFQMVSREYDY